MQALRIKPDQHLAALAKVLGRSEQDVSDRIIQRLAEADELDLDNHELAGTTMEEFKRGTNFAAYGYTGIILWCLGKRTVQVENAFKNLTFYGTATGEDACNLCGCSLNEDEYCSNFYCKNRAPHFEEMKFD